jgi:hypothetical protein
MFSLNISESFFAFKLKYEKFEDIHPSMLERIGSIVKVPKIINETIGAIVFFFC